MGELVRIITATDPEVRNRSLDAFCRGASLAALLEECAELDAFRRRSSNLYAHVRALFFLYAIHRFHLPGKEGIADCGRVPFAGYTHLLERRFEEAIDAFLAVQESDGPSDAISSALAAAYHGLGFQTLADQVRRSVRSVRGNQWMFRVGHPMDQPLRIHPELLRRTGTPQSEIRNPKSELPLYVSPGRAIGLRLVPMVRDLRFAWDETAQQVLDEQQQKVRESLHHALIEWARSTGEGSDYTDNVPLQCVHPVGHWYEVPNLLRNGVLAHLLRERPQLQYLMLHNIDTLGADLDPGLLGWHIRDGACLTYEVITRRIEDRGGGLARVNDRVRLVEGLAMPREEDEFALSYYNTNTVWIHIDKLLALFRLSRADLEDAVRVAAAIRRVAARMPTYVTLKEVKKRWGHGQEDVFPVAQFEKLWGDMTSLPEAECRFVVVPRLRGQQLKDQAQLDGWLRDGSAAYVESRCDFAD
ncbi:MAG: hypothetical protein GX774_04775 [Armatimonadetes bacterium]|nr:hypothetical protein [Armatimonadota bacterium]